MGSNPATSTIERFIRVNEQYTNMPDLTVSDPYLNDHDQTVDYLLDDIEDIGRAGGILLGDHFIQASNERTTFSCSVCDRELEVPEVFQESTGFRQAVYTMFIFGKFKEAPCPGPSMVDDGDGTIPNTRPITTKPNPVPQDNIYWMSDTSLENGEINEAIEKLK